MNRGTDSRGGMLNGVIWILALLVFLIAASLAEAQLPTATVFGVVKDSTGAVVPGASLTARNVDTGQTRTTVTAGDGSYRLSALPVGNYEIKAEHPGFRTEVRSGLSLTVSQEAAVNLTLEVGAIEQTVSVTAEAPLVDTSSGALGGLLGERKVSELPLNGRNYIDLSLLQPGVQKNPNMNGGQGTFYSSNGAPLYSNNVLLDGASLNNIFGNSANAGGTALGVEGIREYRMVTNSFSAEYGMTMGSQMLIVSKSGTNSFHGSLFEYLRNSALDARNFFDYSTPTAPYRLPPFRRNDFGGSVGGPIKKDKTFFFATIEELRDRLGTTNISNTIPAAYKVDGGLVPQISPVIKPFLQYFPDPNLGTNKFTFPFSQVTNERYAQMRVDQNFSASDTLFGRYTIDDDTAIVPRNYPQFNEASESRMQFVTVSENHVFSPVLLNTSRFSYSRPNLAALSASGIIGPQFSFVPGLETGAFSIGGVSSWGASGTDPQRELQNLFTWSDDIFLTKGRHSLKFGTLINHFQRYILSDRTIRGQISFPNIAAFLQAQPSSYTAVTPGSILDRTFHYSTLGFYVQDDVRVRPNLMLNVGLRYEFQTQFNEIHGVQAALRNVTTDTSVTLGPLYKNPSLHNFGPRIGFAWDVMGDGKTAVRGGFGLLYDIASVSHILTQIEATPPFAGTSTVSNPPTLTLPLFLPTTIAAGQLHGIDYSLKQPHMLQYNLTVERQLPWDMVATLAYAGSRGLNIITETEGNPTVPTILPNGQQFWTGSDPRVNPNFGSYDLRTASGSSRYNALQFGILKRLSKGLELQSAFTWSKNLDEPQCQTSGDSITSVCYPSDPSNIKLDYGYSAVDIPLNWHFNAIYRLPEIAHSGALKNLINGWGINGILTLQSGFAFSVTNASNTSRSKVLGGATITPGAASSDRPNVNPGSTVSSIEHGTSIGCPGFPAGAPLGTVNLWFDPCAFSVQSPGFLGNAARDFLRGPGLANLDFSITKDSPLRFLGEAGRLQFRAEFFNILNRVQFGTPAQGGSFNTAGIVFAGVRAGEAPLSTAAGITSTIATSRQIQLALKLVF